MPAPTVCPESLSELVLSRCESIGQQLSAQQCAELGGCWSEPSCYKSPVPSLDDLAGDWQDIAQVYNYPSVEGFHGGVGTTSNLLSYTGGTFPPLSQGASSLILRLGGKELNATFAKWWPYQVQRNAVAGAVNMTSTIRMGFELPVILLRLDFQNTGDNATTVPLELDLDSLWSYEPGTWQVNCT